MIHDELKAVFAEHAAPTHADTAAVHAALQPILALASLVEKQIAVYRDLLLKAKLAPQHPDLISKIEHFKQKIGKARDSIHGLIAAGEGLSEAMTQLDYEITQGRADLARWQAAQAEKLDPAPDHG